MSHRMLYATVCNVNEWLFRLSQISFKEIGQKKQTQLFQIREFPGELTLDMQIATKTFSNLQGFLK